MTSLLPLPPPSERSARNQLGRHCAALAIQSASYAIDASLNPVPNDMLGQAGSDLCCATKKQDLAKHLQIVEAHRRSKQWLTGQHRFMLRASQRRRQP